MMKIIIKYDSCWRNSFLSGTNNDPISKENERKFIASSKELPKNNFKECKITQDTIMGILNRLIGDQKKLYKSRKAKEYYFQQLENNFIEKVKFDDNIQISQQEVVYLRNKNLVTDPKSFSGIINTGHSIFNCGNAKDLWKIIFCEFDELIECIVKQDYSSIKPLELAQLNPIKITYKLKSLANEQIILDNINLDNFKQSLKLITDFQIEKATQFNQFNQFNQWFFYACAFSEQIKRLQYKGYNVFTEEEAENILGKAKNFKYEQDHVLFNSDYSTKLWNIIFCEFNEIIQFILDENYQVKSQLENLDLASIKSRLNELIKSKFKIDKSDITAKKVLNIIRAKYYNEKGVLPKKFSFYAYAFYEQIKRLKSKGCNVFTEKKGGISGISANSFTTRAFATYFAKEKPIYGAPYKLDDKALTKATGELTIKLYISDDQAQDLQQKILDAGVSPFYLGKKGVAYVKDIRVNGTSIYDDY